MALDPIAQNGPRDLARLDLLRFPLIVLVVYIHAYGTTMQMGGSAVGLGNAGRLPQLIQYVLSQEVARVAVPLFYAVAGYLFFRDGSLTWDQYRGKLRSRVWTLVIPYFFWNVLLFAIIWIAQQIPATAGFFNSANAPLSQLGAAGKLDAVLGISRAPIAYQFWFVRDLIVLVVLTPLLFLLLRHLGMTLVTAFYFFWLADLSLPVPGIEPVLFFSIGAYAGLKRISPFVLDSYGWLMLAGYGLLVIVSTLAAGTMPGSLAHKLAITVGAASALFLTKAAMKSDGWNKALRSLAAASFFVFATHEPLITTGKKVLYRFADISPWTVLSIYLLLPVVVVATMTALYFAAARLVPAPMRLITGGR